MLFELFKNRKRRLPLRCILIKIISGKNEKDLLNLGQLKGNLIDSSRTGRRQKI